MTEMEVRRVRLFATAARLTDFDTAVALDRARQELGQRRDDVELLDVEVWQADSVVIALRLPPSVPVDDVVDDVRSGLGLGPGDHVPWPGPEAVRGLGGRPGPDWGGVVGAPSPGPDTREAIGGSSRTCPGCSQTDGTHLPGCKYRRRGTSR